jgi:hypothetical protein
MVVVGGCHQVREQGAGGGGGQVVIVIVMGEGDSIRYNAELEDEEN